MANGIKPKAICVFRFGGNILVAEYFDPIKKEPFYRPLGGKIEFGEQSQKAVKREIKEEIDAEVGNLRYLGVIENIYHHKGKQSHELMFIYDGEFLEDSYYMQSSIEGFEITDDRKFKVHWKSLNDFADGTLTLYPEGLLELIMEDKLKEQQIIAPTEAKEKELSALVET
ncbi:MAG: NUDIX domain-containing protein [Candidatus Heimdallarchaeota archaeon]|nr:NUDIX domain-containing protein [Candidatus Heimdallarchaeota archaeon]